MGSFVRALKGDVLKRKLLKHGQAVDVADYRAVVPVRIDQGVEGCFDSRVDRQTAACVPEGAHEAGKKFEVIDMLEIVRVEN
jgi:hypothetical protein